MERAANSARQLQTNLESYEFGAFDYTVRLRWTALEFQRRYGQALACFIMFFIGAPLGALIRKGGIGVSAIISLLFFVLYWVIDITGVKLARDGSISTVAGAFASAWSPPADRPVPDLEGDPRHGHLKSGQHKELVEKGKE